MSPPTIWPGWRSGSGPIGKRSSIGRTPAFDRRHLDGYATPFSAVVPLVPHLDGVKSYVEPCCGDGDLIAHLYALRPRLSCTSWTDLRFGVDALSLTSVTADCIISNPPWQRQTLHALIEHLAGLAPAWLLFDADWMHTRQAALLLTLCSDIVSVGRVKWIRDSPNTGKDNCCWYRFERGHHGAPRFHAREP